MSTNTASLSNYHPQTPKRKPADYSDIINYARPRAKNPISIEARAAQFSPYAALVGHKDIVANDEAIANNKTNIDHDVTIEYDEYKLGENYDY